MNFATAFAVVLLGNYHTIEMCKLRGIIIHH